MEKLIKIQNELKAPKSQYNAFGKYKYRSCEDILEALKPLLLKYGCTLTISDCVDEVGGMIYVNACVTINDGENQQSVNAQAGINPDKKGMDISQSFGSSSSYARKYALNGLFLIDDTKDADTEKPAEKKDIKVLIGKIAAAKSIDELTDIYNDHIEIKTSQDAMSALRSRKEQLLKKTTIA